MPLTLQRWKTFLEIDELTADDLGEFAGFLLPHIDSLLDGFYERLLHHERTARMFPDDASFQGIRDKLGRHWSDRVFIGEFDLDFLAETRAIGRTHFRLGIDAAIFSAAYCFVLTDIAGLMLDHLPAEVGLQHRFSAAIRKAVFLDLGLATEAYHHAYVAELQSLSRELIEGLARAGEYRDDQTGRHVERVGAMCRELAVAAGMGEAWADQLETASRLHDVGKIGVPDRILFKPGPLSDGETATMREHAEIGATIIPNSRHEIIRLARSTALTHHERWDGTGYPYGLRAQQIPIEGRISTICDVYDALLTRRPYKPAWSRERAVEFISEGSGTLFDPRLVRCFEAILPAIDAIQAAGRTPEPPDDIVL